MGVASLWSARIESQHSTAHRPSFSRTCDEPVPKDSSPQRSGVSCGAADARARETGSAMFEVRVRWGQPFSSCA